MIKATLLPDAKQLIKEHQQLLHQQQQSNNNKGTTKTTTTTHTNNSPSLSLPQTLPSSLFSSTDQLAKFFSHINEAQVYFVSKSMLPRLNEFLYYKKTDVSLLGDLASQKHLAPSLLPPLKETTDIDAEIVTVVNSDIAIATANPTTLSEISRTQSKIFQLSLSSTPLAPKTDFRPLSALDEQLHDIVSRKDSDQALEELTEFLAENEDDANLNISSNHYRHGGTALHTAASLGRTELVLKLIEYGADIDAQATNLSTPLHWAAGMGKLETVKALIGQGADTTARTSTWHSQVFGKASGQTPAHWAAESGYLDVLKVLHASHATVIGMEDERETTPLALADKEMKGECSEFLKKAAEEEYFAVKFSVQFQDQVILSGKPSSPDLDTKGISR